MRINTVNEWMEQLAEAMREGDFDKIQACRRASLDWLQPEQERVAQMQLVETVEEVMMDIEDMA